MFHHVWSVGGAVFLSLAVAAGTPAIAQAQHRGSVGVQHTGFHGGFGVPHSGFRGGVTHSAPLNRSFDHRTFSRGAYYYPYGFGYGYSPGYSSYGYSYSPGYASDSYDPTYYGYSYDTPAVTGGPAVPEPVTPTAEPDRPAHVTLKVPADAVVTFDGVKTDAKGAVREYNSPPLAAGKQFSYDVTAKWEEDGHTVTQTQNVPVSAGAHPTVTFPMTGAALHMPR